MCVCILYAVRVCECCVNRTKQKRNEESLHFWSRTICVKSSFRAQSFSVFSCVCHILFIGQSTNVTPLLLWLLSPLASDVLTWIDSEFTKKNRVLKVGSYEVISKTTETIDLIWLFDTNTTNVFITYVSNA